MLYYSDSEKRTREIAKEFAATLKKGDVVLFLNDVPDRYGV